MNKPIPEMTASDIARFWRKVDVRGPDDCWPWLAAVNGGGYGCFDIRGGSYRAARVSMAIDGRDPLELCACHTCDNPPCCNPSHLFTGTVAHNNADMVAKGRQSKGLTHFSRTKPDCVARGDRNGSRTKPENRPRGALHPSVTKPECLARGNKNGARTHPEKLLRGENNRSSKLTETDIAAIRADCRVHRAIACDYSVAQTTISKIKRRAAWAHIR